MEVCTGGLDDIVARSGDLGSKCRCWWNKAGGGRVEIGGEGRMIVEVSGMKIGG